MSNFDGLFLLDFLFNRLQTLAQKGNKMLSYDFFLRIHSCSSGFMQDFLDYYVGRCRFNDVQVE